MTEYMTAPEPTYREMIMNAWQKVEKTRAVLFGIAGASAVLVLPGTTTLWRCVVGVCIVIASVAYDLRPTDAPQHGTDQPAP